MAEIFVTEIIALKLSQKPPLDDPSFAMHYDKPRSIKRLARYSVVRRKSENFVHQRAFAHTRMVSCVQKPWDRQTRRKQIAHGKFNYRLLFEVSSLETQTVDTKLLLTRVIYTLSRLLVSFRRAFNISNNNEKKICIV